MLAWKLYNIKHSKYEFINKPIPKKRELLLKILATSINNADINLQTGWYSAKKNHEQFLQSLLL